MTVERSLIDEWIAQDPDPQTKEELHSLISQGNETELQARFSGRLEFGTAGLRGLLGAGPSRMNRLVVRQTAAGLGQYLLDTVPGAAQAGVVVGYDARRLSREMAQDTACVLCAMGLSVHLFDNLAPTPLVAFGVRQLSAAAGVMVTASHNPPQYNGFKVYWGTGAQISPPHDRGIASAIQVASKSGALPWMSLSQSTATGRLAPIGPELVDDYLRGLETLSLHPRTHARSMLRIAYTPLHGVGRDLAFEALLRSGFSDVHVVPTQAEPDGSFPTVNFPNPEEPGALDAVLKLANQVNADLACANDPDADRLCAAIRRKNGSYRVLSGDELGVLLGWNHLTHGPSPCAVGTTIVSSRLLGRIARRAGTAYYETLTGFKWLAGEALVQEARGILNIFAYEEALGYGFMHFVRDKDGVSALVSLCELAAALAQEGKTLLDLLEELYREHGLLLSGQRTIALSPGTPNLGQLLRKNPPTHIAGLPILGVEDFLPGPKGFSPSDVLVFHLEGESRAIVRPSGTEPKVKCYYEVQDALGPDETFEQAESRARRFLDRLADTHLAELRSLVTQSTEKR
jgi:phosphomannomutase